MTSSTTGAPPEIRDVGLCCGSIVQAGLFDLADAASHAGFSAVTIWPTKYAEAIAAGSRPAEIRRRLDSLGVRVVELDPLCSWLPVDIPPTSMTAAFATFDEDDFYATADVLGCEALNVIRADDVDLADELVVDHLGALADRAAARGLRIQFEFLPWSPVADLAHALRLVAAVGRPNCGVHIDVWHHLRSGGTVEQLARVDPSLVAAVQFSDADPDPWDDLFLETSSGRRLPGHGDGTAAAAASALASAGVRAPMSLEVFSTELMGLDPRAAADRLAASVAALVRSRS